MARFDPSVVPRLAMSNLRRALVGSGSRRPARVTNLRQHASHWLSTYLLHKPCTGVVQRARRGVAQLQQLGDRVRATRLRRGLTEEDLAEVAGLHRTYLGHVERGEVNLSMVNLLKVAAALGVDAGGLVKGLAPQQIGDPRDV